MLTKGAIGNLVNRYKAVLKKCNLINTFGSLAVASMLVLGGAGVAGAEVITITDGITVNAEETKAVIGDAGSSITGDIVNNGKVSIELSEGSVIDGRITVGNSEDFFSAVPELALTGPISISGQSAGNGGAIETSWVKKEASGGGGGLLGSLFG